MSQGSDSDKNEQAVGQEVDSQAKQPETNVQKLKNKLGELNWNINFDRFRNIDFTSIRKVCLVPISIFRK